VTAGITPYPAYTNSGVPWLGQVPEHWEVQRAKRIFRCIDVRSLGGDEELLTVSSARGVIPRSTAAVTMFKAESYRGYKLCWPGDLVINSLWAWAGGLGVSRHHGIISSAYSVYRPRDGYVAYSSFIDELVRSKPFQWELQVRSKGIWISRLQLTDEFFLNAPIPIPPPTDQVAIVRYLDHADRKVRHAIRARQQLIKLLTEEKQAVIQRAVTRGLDPSVRLKPSGVAWLGDVPEHWQVTRLARIVRSSNAGEVIDKGWWGRGKEVLYTCARDPFQSDYPNFPARKRTTGVDLLVTRNGTPYVHLPVADALYSNVVQRINLVPGSNRQYVALSLEEAARSMKGYGVSIESLNYDMWKELVLVVPPTMEQAAIVHYVDAIKARLDEVIDAALREIDLLREYRTRLIADVVSRTTRPTCHPRSWKASTMLNP
jgi:type I restriction enzyme S subunit